MFINLTCRKANGDFFITSSEVEMEKYPSIDETEMPVYMMSLAQTYFNAGWNVELTQEAV